jgi:hypothetical protein
VVSGSITEISGQFFRQVFAASSQSSRQTVSEPHRDLHVHLVFSHLVRQVFPSGLL